MNDLKFAIRQLLKNPGFTAVAVLTLALGIGANTAIFSVVNGVLLKPLPYSEPGQLVMVFEDTTGDGRGLNAVAGGVFMDWREQTASFEALSVISGADMNLTGGAEPERVSGGQVSANFLSILRVEPTIGRGFASDEDQLGHDNRVVVLSHDLWQRRFGGDKSLVGRPIRLSGEQYTVIGVLPPKALSWNAQFLVPFVFGTEEWQKSRDDQRFSVIARLKPGVSVEQANAELKALKQRLLPLYPKGKEKWGFLAKRYHEVITSNVKPTLLVLFGAVGVVLLIAAANVANLLLAKAASRQKEMAIRAALGASRWRVMRQVLTESVVLAGFGGGLGVVLAYFGVDVLSKLREETLPLAREVSLDPWVLAFSIVTSLATGFVFGLVPASGVSRVDLNATLKEGGRGSTTGGHNRLRGALIVSEVALALVLLVTAGLLLRSFWNLWSSPVGFNPHNVLALDISLPETKYPNGERRARFLEQVFERVEALPRVEAASAATSTPML
ncbi:MAG: ABC transporter permease, partial [Verrucomicrobiales bacterium]|nr:ABC transporter permease [Verrucomicrobiales bacterium]